MQSVRPVGSRWWETAVGYEVYIRSFADGNGDGIGDFVGLTARLDHLAWLGVDTVWVTPFYPSPQRDFGYDVADYCDVAPEYGTLEDFDRFVVRCRELGLRVMVDIVPNHCSSDHPWFLEALSDPSSPKRDYFIWKDPAAGGGPPNNWLAIFGGSAWALDEVSGQYWMHLFLPEQPDLNWENPAVRDEFEDILRFWLDRGVDGFRIDVAHSLVKDRSFADNVVRPGLDVAHEFGDFSVHHDIDQDGVFEIYEAWSRIAAEYDAVLLGEAWEKPTRIWEYTRPGRLDHSFYFGLMNREWDPVDFAVDVRHAIAGVPDGHAWVHGSHDESRCATRFGGGALGFERSLALWVGMMGLPGVPFLYQGDELGLEDGYVAPADVQDPVGLRDPDDGRDPCRTPIPWEAGIPHSGFTTGERAWLRSRPRLPEESVSFQRGDATSPLHRTRALLMTRRALAGARVDPVEWLPAPAGVLLYRRGTTIHAANLLDESVRCAIPAGAWGTAHATNGGRLEDGRTVVLPGPGGVILKETS